MHSVKLLAEVSDGEGSITSLVTLKAERRYCCGADRVRTWELQTLTLALALALALDLTLALALTRWELQFALHLEALRFCQLVQAPLHHGPP